MHSTAYWQNVEIQTRDAANVSLTYYVIFIQIAGPFMEHITAAGDLNNCTSGQKKYSAQSK